MGQMSYAIGFVGDDQVCEYYYGAADQVNNAMKGKIGEIVTIKYMENRRQMEKYIAEAKAFLQDVHYARFVKYEREYEGSVSYGMEA